MLQTRSSMYLSLSSASLDSTQSLSASPCRRALLASVGHTVVLLLLTVAVGHTVASRGLLPPRIPDRPGRANRSE